MFLDGDAFPVASLDAPLAALLNDHELVAVRRDENGGECQPHPSFCATTVKFWRTLGVGWSHGYCFTTPDGMRVFEGGGRLLQALTKARVQWLPLLRVAPGAGPELHPVFFGCYGTAPFGPLLYHHGAGFHEPTSRADALLGTVHRANGTAQADDKRAVIARNTALSAYVRQSIDGTDDFWDRLCQPSGLEASSGSDQYYSAAAIVE